MEEHLNEKIDEEKRDQLIRRINELYESGVLKIRDWMAIYEIFINACNREAANAYEDYMLHILEEDVDEGDAE